MTDATLAKITILTNSYFNHETFTSCKKKSSILFLIEEPCL